MHLIKLLQFPNHLFFNDWFSDTTNSFKENIIVSAVSGNDVPQVDNGWIFVV